MSKDQYSYTFTVFTPTYDRSDLLKRVYDSLEEQTYKDFEWLIVDDGSTDSTRDFIENLQSTASFDIHYSWKENGGKYTAINQGVSEARGRYFAIMDSDDWYLPDALEKMLECWNHVPDETKNSYKGVCGLFEYESGVFVGSKFPKDIFESNDIEIFYIYLI